MKLTTIITLVKESAGFGTHGGSMGGTVSSQDSQLHPMPGGMDDVESWEGVTEGKGWFCYREANDWHTKRAGASIYITEGEPHKFWIRIKTHGLRKSNDTNEGYRQRINKHADKVARAWMSEAKKLHNNPEINEVGNELQMTWKEAFKLALESSKVKPFIAEWGDCPTYKTKNKEVSAISDPVNFTPRLEEQQRISYSAIVLDNQYKQKLLTALADKIPQGWEKIAHHMTIKLGELTPELKPQIGQVVNIMATEIGISDKAVAVKVTGKPAGWTTNKVPHITLAVNRVGGGKPVDSNKITNWEKLPQPIPLWGKVEEVPFTPKDD